MAEQNLNIDEMSDDELMAMEEAPALSDEALASEDESADIVEPGESYETASEPEAPSELEDEPENEPALEAAEEDTDVDLSPDESYTTPQHTEEVDAEDSKEAEETAEAAEPEDTGSAPEAKGEENVTQKNEGAVDYKAAYEQIMAPFKANGREIKLGSPDDVVRLMQQGANYTKKMQSLKPNLRLIRMLENNGLMDEEKVSFLIDLNKRAPDAVKKFLKDSSIDPLDIDLDSESSYKPGNHKVSDQEMVFQDVLQDMMSTEVGQGTVSMVHKDWDQSSKEALYQEPEILKIISDQRGNGIYDRISSEMDNRKMLGTLDPNTPFLTAYRQVGDELHAAGQLVLAAPQSTQQEQAYEQQAAPTQQPRVIATRPSTTRQAAGNGERAKAAGAARTGSKPAAKQFDPLAMTDDEIMAMDFPYRG